MRYITSYMRYVASHIGYIISQEEHEHYPFVISREVTDEVITNLSYIYSA